MSGMPAIGALYVIELNIQEHAFAAFESKLRLVVRHGQVAR
jgi:hypothetical protein